MEVHNPMYTPSKEGMKAKGYKYHSSLDAMNAAAKRNGEIKKKSLSKALERKKRVNTDHEDFINRMKSKYPNYKPSN